MLDIRTKVCSRCKETKSTDMFSRDRGSRDGLYSQCKPCASLTRKECRERNPERSKQVKRNQDARYRKRNSDLILSRVKSWQARNPEALREISRRYRARLNAVSVCDLTPEQWNRILYFYGGVCCYCGSGERITLDHVVPLSLGGGHTASNVVPACKSCNSKKHDLNVYEWVGRMNQA